MSAVHFKWLDWIILVLYFGSMASMGPYFAKRNKSTESYFLGNRSFPGWLVGLSMFATSISSITFVAYPADAYKTAYLRLLLTITLPVAIFVAAYWFLPFFRRGMITSAFEYLEGRFGPNVRSYAAITFIVGQLLRISLILYLVALLVQEMTGLNAYYAILIGGLVTSFYTITGGIEAVMWTDFFQSFLLWGGGFLCLFVIIFSLDGGLATIIREAAADHKFMLGDLVDGKLQKAPLGFSLSQKTVLMVILVGLTNWLTEYSSNQNVIQRYCASKSASEARKAMWICAICSIPTWAFFMFLGTSLYVYYKLNPDPAAADMLTGANGAKAESILPYFVIKQLPMGLSGLVVAGVLAAAMSSLSSSINAISAVSIVDIYKRRLVKGRDDNHYVVAAKLIALAVSVIMLVGAFTLMFAQTKTLQDTATEFGAMLAGGLMGLYMLGFLTKHGSGTSVGIGICFTLAWTGFIALRKLGVIPPVFSFDNYYAGIIGNLIMFFTGYILGVIIDAITGRQKDLTNLTIWTQDKTPIT